MVCKNWSAFHQTTPRNTIHRDISLRVCRLSVDSDRLMKSTLAWEFRQYWKVDNNDVKDQFWVNCQQSTFARKLEFFSLFSNAITRREFRKVSIAKRSQDTWTQTYSILRAPIPLPTQKSRQSQPPYISVTTEELRILASRSSPRTPTLKFLNLVGLIGVSTDVNYR